MNDDEFEHAAEMSSLVIQKAAEMRADIIARSVHRVCPECLRIGEIILTVAQLRVMAEHQPEDLEGLAPSIASLEIRLEALITGTGDTSGPVQ